MMLRKARNSYLESSDLLYSYQSPSALSRGLLSWPVEKGGNPVHQGHFICVCVCDYFSKKQTGILFFMKIELVLFTFIHTELLHLYSDFAAVQSWQLSEDFGMVMDRTMLMYLYFVLLEQICHVAAVVDVDYCCCKVSTGICYANTYADTVL